MERFIKIFVSLVLICGLGCGERPKKLDEKVINGWTVSLCFEKDGYKVYSFTAYGESTMYYVVPEGRTIEALHDGEGNRTGVRVIQTVQP